MRARMNAKRMPSRQHGSVAVLVALFLVVLLGFGALALDLGRVFVVRNQLQNAADAAALAGAGSLSGEWGENYIKPNWEAARTTAELAVQLNDADGSTLVRGKVETGFWNVTGTPAGLRPTSITPGPFDKPAVMVTISRSADNNGGPLRLFLAHVIGVPTLSLSATAVAAISAPGHGGAGSLFPMVLAKCLYDKYWDSKDGKPISDPASGQPYEFKIGSSLHYGACSSGAWTTFKEKDNNVPAARDLIANGNPVGMSIGDITWIQPGTKNTLYSSVPVRSDVLLPVVLDIDTNNYAPIVAFAPFHITTSVGGNEKYIEGHFIANYKAPRTGAGPGNGIYYGAVVPPFLVQ